LSTLGCLTVVPHGAGWQRERECGRVLQGAASLRPGSAPLRLCCTLGNRAGRHAVAAQHGELDVYNLETEKEDCESEPSTAQSNALKKEFPNWRSVWWPTPSTAAKLWRRSANSSIGIRLDLQGSASPPPGRTCLMDVQHKINIAPAISAKVQIQNQSVRL